MKNKWKAYFIVFGISILLLPFLYLNNQKTNTTVTPYYQLDNLDTLAVGWTIGRTPDSSWKFFSKAHSLIKAGSFEKGLLRGKWRYLGGDSCIIDWTPVMDSTDGMYFSIPNTFLFDSENKEDNLRFIENDVKYSDVIQISKSSMNYAEYLKEIKNSNDDKNSVSICDLIKLKSNRASYFSKKENITYEGSNLVVYTFYGFFNGFKYTIICVFKNDKNIDCKYLLYSEMVQFFRVQNSYLYDSFSMIESVCACPPPAVPRVSQLRGFAPPAVPRVSQ